MPEFIYIALNNRGKTYRGTIVADDLDNALFILKNKNVYVLDIKQKGLFQQDINLPFRQKVNKKELFIFCRQFATMLMAGISIINCLDILKNQNKGRYFGRVLEDIYDKVEKGNTLSSSMRDHPNVFPQILINMVESGEISGSLDKAMDKMAIHFEKEIKLRQKVINALIYPVIVICMAVVVMIFFLTFVIPTFVGMFTELSIQLPSITAFLINSSRFIANNWLYILIVLIIVYILFNLLKKSKQGSVLIDRLKLKVPLIGGIILGQIISRFTRTLATLLGAGVNLLTALDTTKRIMSNSYIEKEFDSVIDRVKGGEGLTQPISGIKIFPQILIVMVRTGEESGRLEEMLEKAADYYENEVENQISRLTALFEPLMIIFLALMIGFLVASIILPLFRMYGNVSI